MEGSSMDVLMVVRWRSALLMDVHWTEAGCCRMELAVNGRTSYGLAAGHATVERAADGQAADGSR